MKSVKQAVKNVLRRLAHGLRGLTGLPLPPAGPLPAAPEAPALVIPPGSRLPVYIVTGADARMFENLKILIGSWWQHARQLELLCCDYGLHAAQRALLQHIPGLRVLSRRAPPEHPWVEKARLGQYLAENDIPWQVVAWMDADAFFNRTPPDWPALLQGYDLLADAHREAVGQITPAALQNRLGLHPDDAYFSAGFWVTTSPEFLSLYRDLTLIAAGQSRLWEADAFVAAVYRLKLRVRTVNGSVWHCRGKTSLFTCTVQAGAAWHAGQRVHVVHANAGYTTRADGRRVFKRRDLAALQEHYRTQFEGILSENPAGRPIG